MPPATRSSRTRSTRQSTRPPSSTSRDRTSTSSRTLHSGRRSRRGTGRTSMTSGLTPSMQVRLQIESHFPWVRKHWYQARRMSGPACGTLALRSAPRCARTSPLEGSSAKSADSTPSTTCGMRKFIFPMQVRTAWPKKNGRLL